MFGRSRFWIPLLFSLALPIHAAQPEALKRTLILGYDSAIDNPAWRDRLVGFGVKNQLRLLLRERLADSEILDEKVLDAASTANNKMQLENSVAPRWMIDAETTSAQHLHNLSQQYGVSDIYWVKVLDFAKPKSRLSFALWSSQSERSELTLEVCCYTAADTDYRCKEGYAASTQNMDAFFYQPIDDSEKRQEHFDQSAIGKITLEALKKAIADIPN